MSGAEAVDLSDRDPNGLNAHLGVSIHVQYIQIHIEYQVKFCKAAIVVTHDM